MTNQHSPVDARPVALVTGATRGIGRAIAQELSGSHHVLVGGTGAEAVAAMVAELDSAAPFVADLTDPAAVADAVAGLDRLDLLVHSAGVVADGTVIETDRSTWLRVLDVNVVAVAELTRLTLPLLREAEGTVVMLNSGSGFTAGPGGAVYAASKFALRALTDALREEERDRVRVTSIHPGRTDSDMQRELQAGMGREYDPGEFLTPEAVADTVRLAVDTPAGGMITELSIRPVFTARPGAPLRPGRKPA